MIQQEEYYPFGMVSESSQRENSLPNEYKYNGKEEQTELNLGWLDYGQRMYEPTLGRFFTEDRFAEKYFDQNPYSYAFNNPALYIDVNGDSVWTVNKSSVDNKGNTTITHTIHIQGKVLKQSYGNTDAGTVANGLNARLNAQSVTNSSKNDNGTITTETTKIVANYSAAASMDNVSASDHLVVIVDGVAGKGDPRLGGGDASGLGQTPGKVAYIEGGSDASENAFHEVGHNLGLKHPEVNNSKDPMSYTGSGANFSKDQMNQVLDNGVSGSPNRGSNYGIMRTSYPGVSQNTFGVSTNQRPFKMTPAQNAKIPLPLINPYK